MRFSQELIDPDLPGYVLAQAVGGSFPGVLRSEYLEAAGMAGTFPVLRCDATDAATMGAVVGTALTIDGTGYTLRLRQPITGGGADLVLEEQ